MLCNNDKYLIVTHKQRGYSESFFGLISYSLLLKFECPIWEENLEIDSDRFKSYLNAGFAEKKVSYNEVVDFFTNEINYLKQSNIEYLQLYQWVRGLKERGHQLNFLDY